MPLRSKSCLLLACVALSLVLAYTFLFRPPSGSAVPKSIVIKRGDSLKKIATLLEQEGIIRHRMVFLALASFLPKQRELKAGEYEFHASLHPWEVLDLLSKGQVKQHLVTITEGLTLAQVAQLLEERGLAEKKAFLEKASSPALILSLGLPYSTASKPASSLEGYLFPDTYHLTKGMSPEEIIRMMVLQFHRVFNKEWIQRASQLGLSQKEVVILASIIEKEAALAEEKPLVSAVFHNRLKRKMPLQSDPTVIYGIKDFNGNLTRADLERPSPYNTYLIRGLPPTPICNPGRESILAALYPSPVSYLYFVSKNDGSHHFSQTAEEHHRAVWRYQKDGRKSLTKK